MNEFIASNEIVSAIYLQIQITLQTNMFIASDKCALYWGQHFRRWRQTPLALETNVFHTGDEHDSAGDEHVEYAHSSFSHKHIASYQQISLKICATSNFQAEFMLR